MAQSSTSADQQALQSEITELEQRLKDARAQLVADELDLPVLPAAHKNIDGHHSKDDAVAALHALLLLSDSALPLGSFAFSSGLESYLAHHKPAGPSVSQLPQFHIFLSLSLATLASTALPYVLAGHRQPQNIEALDNDLDASTPCIVARRASTAQGRALLAVWDRSFSHQYKQTVDSTPGSSTAIDALGAFSTAIRTSKKLNAHLAPLWGLLTHILGVPLHDAAYLFVFSHARTVISAAVRASVMGPYQAQTVLASAELQGRIRRLVSEAWHTKVQDAGQSVPAMDLWMGRHEKLYSRIFNS